MCFFPGGGGGKLKKNLEVGARCKSLGTSVLNVLQARLGHTKLENWSADNEDIAAGFSIAFITKLAECPQC
jgi:hypothetical protein